MIFFFKGKFFEYEAAEEMYHHHLMAPQRGHFVILTL